MRPSVRTALAVAALVGLLAACGGDDDEAAPDDTGEPTTTAVAPRELPADCDPVALDPAELAGLRPDGIPAGYELQPDDVGDTGPSDLAKAVRDDGFPDADRVLREIGFRRGYQWLWARGEADQLIAFVYEFCDEAGAMAYGERDEEDDGLSPFDVSLEGAEGRSAGDAISVARVVVVRGRHLLLAIANAQAGVGEVEDQATHLAEALVAALDERTG